MSIIRRRLNVAFNHSRGDGVTSKTRNVMDAQLLHGWGRLLGDFDDAFRATALPQGARSCPYLVEGPTYELIDNEAVSLAPCLKALPPFERNVKLLDDLAGLLLEKFNYDVILFSQKPG
jgi:hypothetical protein